MPEDKGHPEPNGQSVLDRMIDREARGYRAGATPRADRMWSRIETDVAAAIQSRRRARYTPWLVAGVGIAAALVIGVAIGRRSSPAPATQVASSSPAVSADSLREAMMRAILLSHFGQVEVFLTEVRADLKTGRDDPLRGERSRDLLARTRLIMSHESPRVATVERLLQDLELVLAEISALPDSGVRRAVDSRLLDERLDAGTVLPRIRTLLPGQPSSE